MQTVFSQSSLNTSLLKYFFLTTKDNHRIHKRMLKKQKKKKKITNVCLQNI